QPIPEASFPNDYYLILSLFSILCCFWPVGVIALLKSVETRRYCQNGRLAEAQASSRKAKTYNTIFIGIGVTYHIFLAICRLQSSLSCTSSISALFLNINREDELSNKYVRISLNSTIRRYGTAAFYFFIQQPQKSSTLTGPSPDYLGLSICAIFCCWIIAIFAIMKSMEARTYNQSGDYDRALQASSQAKSYSVAAIIVGLILNGIGTAIALIPPILISIAAAS
uniref:Uncharacterized protein n=1 Tax=Amphimedon queenslandica TaxID=400682 RepID=A0A1X7VFJ0_AMPQE